MLVSIYNFVTQIYFIGIRLAAIGNKKARLWVSGRRGIFERLEKEISSKRADNQRLVWMHCASLGEFEQGRTILESIKKQNQGIQLLVTFFSPSGYEIRKDFPLMDWVFYLPQDSKSNAERFLEIVQPDLAIFVKYEFWYHYLQTLKQKTVPTVLISAVFRPSHPFFKWYGTLHRQMLGFFNQILVQDEASQHLLLEIGVQNVKIVGDCRVDRVMEIAKYPIQLPLVRQFCGQAKILVCGSTWPPDEEILNTIFIDERFRDWKFILAPHNVQLAHIQSIESKTKIPFTRFSNLANADLPNCRLLIVDNIGLLSSMYSFGKIAYIGGGFGHSIHNTLEPIAHGLPVIFGPAEYQKFEEAVWLVENGGGFLVENAKDLLTVFKDLLEDDYLETASKAAQNYVIKNAGATKNSMEVLNTMISW